MAGQEFWVHADGTPCTTDKCRGESNQTKVTPEQSKRDKEWVHTELNTLLCKAPAHPPR